MNVQLSKELINELQKKELMDINEFEIGDEISYYYQTNYNTIEDVLLNHGFYKKEDIFSIKTHFQSNSNDAKNEMSIKFYTNNEMNAVFQFVQGNNIGELRDIQTHKSFINENYFSRDSNGN